MPIDDNIAEDTINNIEDMAKEINRLSSLNNTLYEKNNEHVKEFFSLRQKLRKSRLELTEYKEKCEDKEWYIRYLEERIELQNGAPYDEDD